MRVLGIDLGAKRIGVALSDVTGTLASPLVVLNRSGDRAGDHRALAALVREHDATLVVVGLPLSLSGEAGPAARGALEEVAELQAALGVPVETLDERFTTVSAHQALAAQGRGRRDRRALIDKAAAAVLLQAWLDRARLRETAPGDA